MKKWIQAFRLKTLPLALSNTILGSALAVMDNKFRWSIFALAGITTVFLQVLSNLANDYGDYVNGKDTAERIGPKRMVQSGEITARQMFSAIIILGNLSIVSGVLLILIGVGLSTTKFLLFGLLGMGAIAAAIRYTVGKNPYGYRGLGDLFVFIFFGLIGVLGTYYLHTLSFHWDLLLPASAMGFLSIGVLNMNNMRDYEADKNSGKRTIVVAIGERNAAYYQLFLIAGAVIFMIIFTLINYRSAWQWLFLLSTPLLFMNLKKVFTYKSNLELYPELPRVSLASLLIATLFWLGVII
ncbi:MAG: 1,4-dihydroxy-2-naphthoate polyprenyltransferase [Paludibacter sp.]|nr:1,4-dihydroxy-2-naphthoate polyprenyltransferase [Paludibacter sp.]